MKINILKDKNKTKHATLKVNYKKLKCVQTVLGPDCEKGIPAYIWDVYLLFQFTVYLVNDLFQHRKCYHSGS